MKESRQDPTQLRWAVAECLRGRACEKLQFTHRPGRGVYWLNWSSVDLSDVARRLGCGESSLSSGMTFAHHKVRAGFWLHQTQPEQQGLLDRVKSFIGATPINRHRPDEYPMRDSGYGWYRVYNHQVLSKRELADMSRIEVRDKVMAWLEDFMDSDGSEYRRIEDYFRCLAFSPDDSATREKHSS